MKKLEVGDEVYTISENRWSHDKTYTFGTVIRVTETQAILSTNKERIERTPVAFFDGDERFYTRGDLGKKWQRVTEKVKADFAAEQERQTINRWWEKKDFTFAEKKAIYSHYFPFGQG